MTSRFNFRIGGKLAIVAGTGILMVAAMTANQLRSNVSLDQLGVDAGTRQAIVDNVLAAQIDLERAQLSVRDLRLAIMTDESKAAFAATQTQQAALRRHIEAALRSGRSGRRIATAFSEVAGLDTDYESAVRDLNQATEDYFALLDKRNQNTQTFGKAFDSLLASPALKAFATRQEIEPSPAAGRAGRFQAVRAAGWRFAAKHEPAQEQLIVSGTDKIIALLKQVRGLADDKTVAAGIDGLSELAATAVKLQRDISANVNVRADIVAKRVLPTAQRSEELLTRSISLARSLSDTAAATASSERTSAGRVAMAMGLAVILLMVGSTVFSIVTIARPVRRIGEVLSELATGNKSVAIPYADRGDEVGTTRAPPRPSGPICCISRRWKPSGRRPSSTARCSANRRCISSPTNSTPRSAGSSRRCRRPRPSSRPPPAA